VRKPGKVQTESFGDNDQGGFYVRDKNICRGKIKFSGKTLMTFKKEVSK
jgi:hypothetical protein